MNFYLIYFYFFQIQTSKKFFYKLKKNFREVNNAAELCLKEIKIELEFFFETLDYEVEVQILEILIQQSISVNIQIQLKTFEWINMFFNKYKFFFIQSHKLKKSYKSISYNNIQQSFAKPVEFQNYIFNNNFNKTNSSYNSNFTQNIVNNFNTTKNLINLAAPNTGCSSHTDNTSFFNYQNNFANNNLENQNISNCNNLNNNNNLINNENISPILNHNINYINPISIFNVTPKYLSTTDLTSGVGYGNNNLIIQEGINNKNINITIPNIIYDNNQAEIDLNPKPSPKTDNSFNGKSPNEENIISPEIKIELNINNHNKGEFSLNFKSRKRYRRP